jgi:hypothetical protein
MNHEVNESVKGLVYWVGISLVCAGSFSLIYLAISVFQVVQSPSESELVSWVITSVSNSELLLNGHVGGKLFEVRASQPLHYLFIGIIGLLAIGILARVVSTLITGGVSLIRLSTGEIKDVSDEKTTAGGRKG